MIPEENSIGVIIDENKKERDGTYKTKCYIIIEGKAEYISREKWFEYYDSKKHKINQPLYMENE